MYVWKESCLFLCSWILRKDWRQVAVRHCYHIGCGRDNSKRLGRCLKCIIILHFDWFTLRFFSTSSSQAKSYILCIMSMVFARKTTLNFNQQIDLYLKKQFWPMWEYWQINFFMVHDKIRYLKYRYVIFNGCLKWHFLLIYWTSFQLQQDFCSCWYMLTKLNSWLRLICGEEEVLFLEKTML